MEELYIQLRTLQNQYAGVFESYPRRGIVALVLVRRTRTTRTGCAHLSGIAAVAVDAAVMAAKAVSSG